MRKMLNKEIVLANLKCTIKGEREREREMTYKPVLHVEATMLGFQGVYHCQQNLLVLNKFSEILQTCHGFFLTYTNRKLRRESVCVCVHVLCACMCVCMCCVCACVCV